METLKRGKWLMVAFLILVIAGIAYAGYVATPGVAVAAVSPGPAPFNMFLLINTKPLPGYADIIYALEEGRDNRGPFCAVTFAVSTANPSHPLLAAAPAPIVGGPWYPVPPAGYYGP
ncbi:MAG TPA: hypothetical protein VGG20_16640, partial [Thermoanaerobaculia bacterium]